MSSFLKVHGELEPRRINQMLMSRELHGVSELRVRAGLPVGPAARQRRLTRGGL